MRLMLLVTVSALSLAATQCASKPTKPGVELCQIDVPAQQCICGPTNHPEIAVQRFPLAHCDRATAFSPSDWEKLINYMQELEYYADRKCDGGSGLSH